MIPIAYTSARASMSAAPSHCSGAMYSAVPAVAPSPEASGSPGVGGGSWASHRDPGARAARPKSTMTA